METGMTDGDFETRKVTKRLTTAKINLTISMDTTRRILPTPS